MTRGPRAEASRAAARRSVHALALVVADVLDATGQRTPATDAWLSSWSTGSVGVSPEHASERVRSLLDALHDARLDVWRHVTHEPWQRARVMSRAVAVLSGHRHAEADSRAWCEATYRRHHVALQHAEIDAVRGSR